MMRFVCLLLLLVCSTAHGFDFESDFADSEFSIKARALDYTRASQSGLEGTTYIAQVEVLTVYHGDVAVGDQIELVIFAEDALKGLNRVGILRGEFATNFCVSRAGIYFTDRLYRNREKTIKTLERFSKTGTDYWDRHDCAGLRGSHMDPDSLDYAEPIPDHGGNHSTKYWRQNVSFMTAYERAIKPFVNPAWINEFSGTGISRETFTLDGVEWLHISACVWDECQLHNMNLLYNEEGGEVVALVADTVTYFVGKPSDEAKSLLLTLNDKIYSSRGSIERRLYEPDYYNKILESEKKRRENRTPTEKLIGTLINIYVED